MKLLRFAIRNGSFRSLRLRLMVYLFIAGFVPLICALFVFYQQSSNYAQHEYEQFIRSNHAMLVDRMRTNLTKIAEEASALNEDIRIQQLLLEGDNLASVQSQLRIVLLELIDSFRSSDLPIADVCFTFIDSNISICNDTSLLLNGVANGEYGARIEAVSLQDGEESFLRYSAPIYAAFNREVKGYVIFLIDRGRLMNSPRFMLPMLEHTLLDEQGVALVRMSSGLDSGALMKGTLESSSPIRTTANGVISSQPLDVLSKRWVSVVR